MTIRGIERYGRSLLTAAIAVLVILLLGADYPEHEPPVGDSHRIAEELCMEIPPKLRGDFQRTVAENPVRFIQFCAE